MLHERQLSALSAQTGQSPSGHTKPPDEWAIFGSVPPKRTDRSPPNSVVAGAAISGTGIAPQTVVTAAATLLATAAEPNFAPVILAAGQAAAPAQTPQATER